MPSISQPLSSQQISRTSNLNKSFQSFVDKRPQTAIPVPYIEYITPGKNGARGNVGYFQNGSFVPEINTYIYIYINGFLVNPPELYPDGSFKNTKSAVVSNINGDWSTGDHFFDVLPSFQYGQTITFKAKAPLKQLSERSTLYSIGSTPTPINLGVIGELGFLRKPYAGESSIIGQFSYWYSHDPLKLGQPIFDCNNHVYIYIDGIHAGTTLPVVGEIFRNEIRGINAKFPLVDNIATEALELLVDKSPINIPFINLIPADTTIPIGDKNSVNQNFVFTAPEANVGIRIFKNGVRLYEGADFNYSIDNDTLLGILVLFVPPTPADQIVLIFQYSVENFVLNENPVGVIDGVNDTFALSQVPNQDSLELFSNGLLLNPNIDYILNGSIITFQAGYIPNNVTLMADYQPAGISINQINFSQYSDGIVDGINRFFVFNKPNALGNIHVFLNGLKQIEGVNNDYLRIDNTIVFNPWKIPQVGQKVLIEFYTVPITLKQMINFLNNTPEFKENCLEAKTFNGVALKNFFEFIGQKNNRNKDFAFPILEKDVNIRVYKNGLRQKEEIDYFINFTTYKISFIYPPEPEDILLGFFSYQTDYQIIGEEPLGLINGSNDTFKLTYLPKATTVELYKNGVHLSSNNDYDYKVVGDSIVFTAGIPDVGDILMVDYQLATASNTLISTIIPNGVVDGINTTFAFPIQATGAAYMVYQNGQLLTPNIDYTINKNAIAFISRIPEEGDLILLNINLAKLFTSNLSDQLIISSPYPIELNYYIANNQTFINKNLFGDDINLYPGKDEKGEFYFWINRRTGYWRWSWYDPLTAKSQVFKTGQSITARAINTTPIVYTTPK